jgi:hypothetical protein
MHSTYAPAERVEVLAHHSTGDTKPAAKSIAGHMIGQRVEIKVVRFGKSETVGAVEIECEMPSKNARKHITLWCDRIAGGKPVQSNDITEWVDVEPFTLFGIVQECA